MLDEEFNLSHNHEQNVKVTILDKKCSDRDTESISQISKSPSLKEIYIRKEDTFMSFKNNFDRGFRKEYYQRCIPAEASSADLYIEKRRSSFWQKFRLFISSPKKKSFSNSKDEIDPKKLSSTPKFSNTILDPTQPRQDSLITSTNSSECTKTTVYTHDLIFLTEEDRHEKYEALKKKREMELSKLHSSIEQVEEDPDESFLDLKNAVSRSPSNTDLKSLSSN